MNLVQLCVNINRRNADKNASAFTFCSCRGERVVNGDVPRLVSE